MNYYQHHIGDFIRDTARLTDSQCMAYLRLIWMYYETEQPLENDVDALAFKIGANASDVHQILKHYFFEHEGFWHNSRCDKEILSVRKAKENHWGRRLSRSVRAAIQGDRNASKRNATPKWLTSELRKEIAAVYALAASLTSTTGLRHEVDHIVPIRSKVVCGLHVPWNLQVLTAEDNRRKSNRVGAS